MMNCIRVNITFTESDTFCPRAAYRAGFSMDSERTCSGRQCSTCNRCSFSLCYFSLFLKVLDYATGLSFIHDFSKIGDFSGTIIVDFKSNRYFNLTAYNATGVIHGVVKRTSDKFSPEDFSFTTYIDDLKSSNRTVIVPLPALINGGDRTICLRADDKPVQSEICHVVPFREDPLEINLLENTWKELEGHCADCNKLSMSGFLTNLNPLNWASGVTSLSNFIMVVSDVFVYVFLFIIIYFLITRCLIPICKCGLCPQRILCSCNGHNKSRHHRSCRTLSYD